MDTLKHLFDIRLVRAKKVGLLFEEIHLRKFFEHFKVDCVFDVGANTGQYATMLRRIGYTGVIISFEPMPHCAKFLRQKAVSDPRWYIEEVALSHTSGTEIFNIMKSDQFSSLHAPSQSEVAIFAVQNKIGEQISVTTKTLQEMYAKYKDLLHFKRPFLKMDTQGHDLEIASADSETLQLFVGLQSELSIKKIYADSSDYMQTIKYYTSRGFELSAFVPNNEGHFPQLIEMDCIMYNKNEIPAER